MKIICLFILVLLVACTSGDPYKQLTKLKGVWMISDGEGGAYEEWTKSKGDSMTGRTYKLSGPADTIVSETITLKKEGDDIWYIPSVAGQNNGRPVSFRLVSSDSIGFVFENKEHDFPQRIIYRFVNDDSIVARIESLDNTVKRYFDFYYRRLQ